MQKTIVRGTRFIPHVVEPSFGSDRLFYVALEYAYGIKEDRVVMSFPRCYCADSGWRLPVDEQGWLGYESSSSAEAAGERGLHD